ncbi:Bug family tripartite tricarboxylate transporter substrate binding protein [Zwartia panacis]|uniref:Bug family tripartite tricarboxylate transporter substrate binding protein n=1 Tax=Zwartia panacis TaxID=2683345 RepID=UPI0025B4E49C|nr:tripartite tricarboxylate transporter substrate binding protein [Zwartia panacis]MDN4016371.1 tripartite tricarboxylate transporter substrate binding protein [Zwartia panacis]
MKLRLSLLNLLLTITALCIVPHAFAAYPDKPVKLLVGYGPGGATDIIARVLSKYLSDKWGQAVVVENKPGASGMIAASEVVRASPDGYTLLLGYTPEVSINQLVFSNMRYDPIKDLTPISLAAEAPLVLAVGAKLPAKSLNEILDKGKSSTPLTYGSPGVGGQQHMAGEMLGGATKISLTHIPYKGTGPAVAALVGGQIDLFFATTPPLLGQIRAGKVTPIAVAGSQREKLLPDVPTFVELGYPTIQLTNWFGVFGPRQLPSPVLEKITADVTAALKDPAVVKQLEDQGLTPRPISGSEFAQFIASEMSKYAPIIKSANIQAE